MTLIKWHNITGFFFKFCVDPSVSFKRIMNYLGWNNWDKWYIDPHFNDRGVICLNCFKFCDQFVFLSALICVYMNTFYLDKKSFVWTRPLFSHISANSFLFSSACKQSLFFRFCPPETNYFELSWIHTTHREMSRLLSIGTFPFKMDCINR